MLLSPITVVQPDLIFVAYARRAIVTEQAIEGPPDLVVEILSPTSVEHDRVRKAQVYARYGVPQYWIIAPEEQRLEVYQLHGTVYQRVAIHVGEATFQPSLFPGLTISLAQLWT